MTARLRAQRGVARVALTPCHRSLSFTARAVRRIEARVHSKTVFHETGLIYVRPRADRAGGRFGFRISAVAFCGHALERLVERSVVPLDAPLLHAIDA